MTASVHEISPMEELNYYQVLEMPMLIKQSSRQQKRVFIGVGGRAVAWKRFIVHLGLRKGPDLGERGEWKGSCLYPLLPTHHCSLSYRQSAVE